MARIFVVSNAAMSDEESNGRVLNNLLKKEGNSFLNFCIRGVESSHCQIDFIKVTDHDAFKAFVTLGIKKPQINQERVSSSQPSSGGSKKRKTAFSYLLRNIVWKSRFYSSKKLKQKINDFNPEVVFLMAADAPFLYKIATKEAKKRNVPLIIYSAEDYPLKKYDYLKQKTKAGLNMKIVLRQLRKAAKKAYQLSSANIFNTEELMNAYVDNGFCKKEDCSIVSIPSVLEKSAGSGTNKQITYAGNLIKERCQSLLDVADVLKEIDSSYKLVLYGQIVDEEFKEPLLNHPMIDYRGVIAYQQLVKEIKESEFLIHVEGFSQYNKLDLQYSFSTKIADYLMLGIPTIVYGPEEITSIKYLNGVVPNFVITKKEYLKDSIGLILKHHFAFDPSYEKINEQFSLASVQEKINKIIQPKTK